MHFLIHRRFCILIVMNVSTTGTKDGALGDAWDEALLASERNSFQNLAGSTMATAPVFDGVSSFDFRPDNKAGVSSSAALAKFTVKSPVPITRLSLIPTTTKSQVPALPTGHALVPLSGIFIAVTLLVMVQVIVPRGLIVTSLDNLMVDRLAYLIVEPMVGIKDRLTEGLVVASLSTQEKVMTIRSIIDPVINQPAKETKIGQSNSLYLTAAISGLSPVVDGGLFWFSQIVSDVWDALIYYKNLAVTNWLNFWYGESDADAVSIDEAALRAQIKNEILAELRGDLAPLLNTTSPSITRTSSGQGLVVVPQSKVGDEAEAVTKIKGLFSDPVLVDFDSTGQSGVITPLFGNTTGENYIFVLTPIASQ